MALVIASCQKEKYIVYELDPVVVQAPGVNKNRLKDPIEFISIAYTHAFGSGISPQNLNILSLLYLSFGDKKLLEDLLVKNFINAPGAQIPSDDAMRANVESFVKQCYQRFYNRTPNALELQAMKSRIENNAGITAKMVYYSFMTSSEYRYY